MEEDIILVDKPKGITSFGVISRMRRKLDIRKIGHAGTLDPLATGLMILGVGKGTKKLTNYIKLDKVYETEVLLGIKTSTGDMEGKVLEEVLLEQAPSKEEINDILDEMTGDIDLPVPAFSAIKRGGEALYKKARRGEKVDVPIKQMHIYWAKLLSIKIEDGYYVAKIEMKVSSGTYIRSIAEEIGDRLGVPATVKELRRTVIGDFDISQAKKL
jgi:tRNA pseudouridine55 synthase